jgi:heme/copper-type cytochrome/quinol oxidase subunit 1
MMTAVFRFAAGLGLVVVVVLVGRWLRGARLDPGGWFVSGAVAWVIQGVYMWRMEPGRTVDLQLHDTLFVLAYFQMSLGVAVVFGVIGAIYLTHPSVTARPLNKVIGFFHFWVSLAALYVVLWMEDVKFVNLATGVPGLEFRNFQTYYVVEGAYSAMATLFVGMQVAFVVILVGSLFGRRKRRLRRE